MLYSAFLLDDLGTKSERNKIWKESEAELSSALQMIDVHSTVKGESEARWVYCDIQ